MSDHFKLPLVEWGNFVRDSDGKLVCQLTTESFERDAEARGMIVDAVNAVPTLSADLARAVADRKVLLEACEAALRFARSALDAGLSGFKKSEVAEMIENHGMVVQLKAAITAATGG